METHMLLGFLAYKIDLLASHKGLDVVLMPDKLVKPAYAFWASFPDVPSKLMVFSLTAPQSQALVCCLWHCPVTNEVKGYKNPASSGAVRSFGRALKGGEIPCQGTMERLSAHLGERFSGSPKQVGPVYPPSMPLTIAPAAAKSICPT